MKTYKITFDRIGRRRDVLPVELLADGDDRLAEKIHDHVGDFLASREYDITCSIDERSGYIEGGRFGTFTIEEVPAS